MDDSDGKPTTQPVTWMVAAALAMASGCDRSVESAAAIAKWDAGVVAVDRQAFSPVPLRVLIDLKLQGGQQHRLHLDFVQSVLLEPGIGQTPDDQPPSAGSNRLVTSGAAPTLDALGLKGTRSLLFPESKP